MALFGWCLSDMSKEQHNKCIVSFTYGDEIVCSCPCHTDVDWQPLTTNATTKIKRKRK